MSEREIDVGRVLKELLQATTREDVYFRFSSEELRAILIQLKAFRTHMPRHHPSCSNQNPLDPIGPWRDAFECDCNRPQVGVKQSLRLLFLEMRLEESLAIVRNLLDDRRGSHSSPAAPHQRVRLHHFYHRKGNVNMTTATITDVLPTTRLDGSPLAETDIASITFQKASLAGSPPVLGDPVVLQTNTANAGGLTPDQLTFVDTNPLPGDSYTSFVTDVQGHIGAASTAFVVPAQQAAPSAPQQTVTLA